MQTAIRRPLVVTAVVLILFLCALVVTGVFVRNLVAGSFHTAEEIRSTRALAAEALKHQLDEETGLRGFVATGERLFLEPYYDGHAYLPVTLAHLESALDGLGLHRASNAVRDAAAADATWIRYVADPLLRTKPKNALAIERQGKVILDRFRSDMASIDAGLALRETAVDAGAQRAIELVGAFVSVAVVGLVLLAVVYTTQQLRLGSRLAEERVDAAEERRKSAVLRAAYDAEKRIVDTLQGAFSQRPLPTVPSLRFSATYVPATEETKVGGDWYDAFELPGNRVLFAVGDVAGHGIDAAVTMNRARQSLVSFALLDSDPASVLAHTSAELSREQAPMVTAVAGFADARTYEFCYATAGHPPPLLLEPGRQPRLLECGSLPLGVVPDPTYRTHRIQSVPGAMLVLYTDGAIEHSRDVFAGEALLLASAAQAASNSDVDAASAIHEGIFQGRPVGDDVAILTIAFSLDPASDVTVSADNAQSAFVGRLGRKTNQPAAGSTGRMRNAS